MLNCAYQGVRVGGGGGRGGWSLIFGDDAKESVSGFKISRGWHLCVCCLT